MYVGLRRDASGPPVWDMKSSTRPYTLDSDMIEDTLPETEPAVFHLQKDANTTEYKFVASDGSTPRHVLCQRNHLKLVFWGHGKWEGEVCGLGGKGRGRKDRDKEKKGESEYKDVERQTSQVFCYYLYLKIERCW